MMMEIKSFFNLNLRIDVKMIKHKKLITRKSKLCIKFHIYDLITINICKIILRGSQAFN